MTTSDAIGARDALREVMRSIIPILCSVSLMACATKSETGAVAGAAGGAVVGGLVGGNTGALVGAAIGGLAGYSIGRDMEERDRRQVVYALESDQPVQWQNPDTGYRYEVQPQQTVVQRGRQCREFRMVADVEGQRHPEEVYGTACRQPDGSWEMVN